ncbi:hypothetical protein [Algoriphagus boritolerans]|uniref:hypothetical protein n=1 Tax=Algoriphagus boritolerans TaxID=308111 RepID=UPI0011B07D29|nr:hypothetical protein [Algoriphagus boritolerans]
MNRLKSRSNALKWMEDYGEINREALRWRLAGAAIKLPYAAWCGKTPNIRLHKTGGAFGD